MPQKVGIVGAGLIGRLLAVELQRLGWDVTLFDRDGEAGTQSCTWTGAGMLAPFCELERAETVIGELGVQSLALWPELLQHLDLPVTCYQRGSLMVAHPSDRAELDRIKRVYQKRLTDPAVLRAVGRDEVGELEPELAGRFHEGLYFASEGQVDNRELLVALAATIKSRGIAWLTGVEFAHVGPRQLTHGGRTWSFDWVLDCRGLGARPDLPDLRGVRGELVYVHAPEVHLRRPVRLVHPRYPIYIVPRANDKYLIGATAIESEDRSDIAVRSMLELLSAAYTVHTGFAEARFVEQSVNCRPAFPDNLPRLCHAPGLLRVNGMYRHGFLISPKLLQYILGYLTTGAIPPAAASIFRPA